MNYMEINGEKFGSNDLIGYVTSRLTEIGVNSFQSIHIDALKNRIEIQFDDLVDANIARAIAGTTQPISNTRFSSNNARHFLLELFETSVQEGFC